MTAPMILPDAALAQHIAITGRTVAEHAGLLFARYVWRLMHGVVRA